MKKKMKAAALFFMIICTILTGSACGSSGNVLKIKKGQKYEIQYKINDKEYWNDLSLNTKRELEVERTLKLSVYVEDMDAAGNIRLKLNYIDYDIYKREDANERVFSFKSNEDAVKDALINVIDRDIKASVDPSFSYVDINLDKSEYEKIIGNKNLADYTIAKYKEYYDFLFNENTLKEMILQMFFAFPPVDVKYQDQWIKKYMFRRSDFSVEFDTYIEFLGDEEGGQKVIFNSVSNEVKYPSEILKFDYSGNMEGLMNYVSGKGVGQRSKYSFDISGKMYEKYSEEYPLETAFDLKTEINIDVNKM